MRMLITGGLVARADGVFNTDILIEGDRILELGERLHEAQQPEGTEIVDVSGCVVMPGGVDAHTHVNLTVGDARKALLPQCPFLSSFHILPRRRIYAYRSLHTAGRRNAAPLDAARPAEQTTVRHRPGAFLYAEAG